MGRTPADLTDCATDLLAEHNFDAHNLGAQLSDFQAPLDGFELFTGQSLHLTNEDYRHSSLPFVERNPDDCLSKMAGVKVSCTRE